MRQAASVGVLVVHGIGAQEPGEALAKLWSGLRRAFPDLPERPLEGEPVTLRNGEESAGAAVRFYEVYWADLLEGERVESSFNMNEFSSLAWFPFFNQVRRRYADEPYPIGRVVGLTLLLPLIGFAAFVTYWGARLLAQLWAAIRHRRPARRGLTFVERFREARDLPENLPDYVDSTLDEYAADVFNYVNSAGDSFPSEPGVPDELRGVYVEIVGRFYDQLTRAHRDGCKTVQVVAHSLGTVVAYHALRGLRFDELNCDDDVTEACARVEHIYTIGSPLEKIRFFWPRLKPERNLVGERAVAWDNFVSYFDPVAGVLRRYSEWGEVANHRLLGGGFLSGHVAYERSATFLDTLTRGLTGNPVSLQRTTRQKLEDWGLLLGETLLAPVGLLSLLIAGASLWVLTAASGPFILSLPFRPFVKPETLGPIVDGVALFFGAMMLVTFLVVPFVNASRAVGNDAKRR